MKTMTSPKNISFSKKRLDFTLSPLEHDLMEYEHDEIKNNSCVEEEPPAWLDAIAEARYQDWLAGKITSRNADEVFNDLLAKASKKRSL